RATKGRRGSTNRSRPDHRTAARSGRRRRNQVSAFSLGSRGYVASAENTGLIGKTPHTADQFHLVYVVFPPRTVAAAPCAAGGYRAGPRPRPPRDGPRAPGSRALSPRAAA